MDSRIYDIILYKTFAELKSEAQRTYAGVLWWVLEPVLFMGVFYFVFGVLFNRGTPDFVPFLLVGISLWHWIQATVMQSSNSIMASRPLLQQVAIPQGVFPAITVVTNTLKFLLVFVLLLCFLLAYGIRPGWHWLSATVVLCTTTILILGASFLVAAITPLFPDVRVLLDNGMRALLFLSGVFYDVSNLSSRFSIWFDINPIAIEIDSLRTVLIRDGSLDWGRQLYVACIGGALLYLGHLLIRAFSGQYAKMTA